MAKKSRRGSRYTVSGNVEAQYTDKDKTVLVNKRAITDVHALEVAEEELLANAYARLLVEVRVDTPMTSALLLYSHREIFGDLYEWAGRWRTVKISKPGVIWPPPDFLDQAMEQFEREILSAYPAQSLSDDDSFCRAVGHIQGEFLAIHPFREGNARTIKLLSDLLSLQSGRPLLVYEKSDVGSQRYIEAARAAIQKDYSLMAEIIWDALVAARQSP